jgi:hypothetical protein
VAREVACCDGAVVEPEVMLITGENLQEYFVVNKIVRLREQN